MKLRGNRRNEKIELQMTPMIDIVFQLLVFFIMTFKIVQPEGDFNIRMPAPAANNPTPPEMLPALRVIMTSNEKGDLTSLRLGDDSLTDTPESSAFDKLRGRIIGIVNDAGGPGNAGDQKIELECDYNLDYEYVIQAITAVSGFIKDGQRYQLIEKIEFAPPKGGP